MLVGNFQRRVAAALAVFFLGRGVACAAEYTFQADAGAGGDYNTNLFLSPLPQEDLWSSNVGVNANFSAAEEIWNLTGNTRFQDYFFSNPELDTENIFLTLTGTYLQNERTRWGLRGNFTRDSTRTSFTEVSDLVFQQVGRESKLLNPSWSYALDEQTSLLLDYQFQMTEYDKTERSTFPDSQVHTGTASLEHRYDDRLTLNGVFSYTRYTLPGSTASVPFGPLFSLESVSEETRIDYASLMAGFTYAVDETLDVGLSGGGQYNMTEAGSRSILHDLFGNELQLSNEHLTSETPTWLLSANATKRFERSQIGFEFAKSSSPNIYGDLIDDTRYSFNARHQFTQKLNGTANVAYSERGTGGADTDALLHSVSLQTGLGWNLTEHWLVDASYRYTRQAVDTADSAPDNHAVMLNVRYLWDKVQY